MKAATYLACAGLALFAGQYSKAQIVQNGSFQSDSYGAWTLGGEGGADHNVDGPYTVPGLGSDYAWDDGAVGGVDSVSQNLTVTAGHEYSITFWVDPTEEHGYEYAVLWGGTTVFEEANIDGGNYNSGTGNYDPDVVIGNFVVDNNGGVFTQGVWNEVTVDPMAFSGIVSLEIENRQDPGYTQWTGISVQDLGVPVVGAPDHGPGLAFTAAVLLGLCAASAPAFRRRLI